MPRSSFMRFVHTCDILQKSFQTNDTGQRRPAWSVLHRSTPCFATPAGVRASVRVTPTAEQSDWITLFLPIETEIEYSFRVSDIRYKSHKMYGGVYEVYQIDPAPSFSGKPMYYAVTIKSVIE